MNLRLQALKDMKEDLLMRRGRIQDEIEEDENEIKIPINEYSYNDINRHIMLKPIVQTVYLEKLKKRNPFPSGQDEESKENNQIMLPGYLQ